MIKRTRVHLTAASAVAALTLALSACGSDPAGPSLSGPVVIDGSSTVEPLSAAAGELFMQDHKDVQVTVGTSGTGGGFKKFCVGETDISNASRPIKDAEKQLCTDKNVQFSEIQVANDALTVVVNKANTWVNCLTVAQLKKIWEPTSTVKNWNEVDPSFPNEPLNLYGAGPDSGTFDYFTGVINGKEGDSRKDYNPTEDDNITVQGVAGAKGGLGYFGFSYFEENEAKLKAIQIDGGNGCVAPSVKAAQDGTYTPLARPLFIYPSDTGVKKPQVEKFVEFYIDRNDAIVEAARFVPLTDAQKDKARAALEALKTKAAAK
ncbi:MULTISPECIES: PstS family phosphate ABC transporter substrate-binding protein [Nocardia]|jgi:phosphate transport system substrate-binding protein|uniref:Phosphate-binding protein n=1 Tax=Nocardia ignorata TaxID=145285 RepID=A0A4R6PLL2_NOCIG|nr:MULTISPECIES: PstS family phosphate ABC transporter substrate-binding protein [Nocardia]TDP38543.1 phosphate ABC transporter substrate-binding protein (PhoT family) [Nocardia ignorata]